MGCEKDFHDDPVPKLSLFSLPNKPQQPGLSTPPIHTLASVPFKWEEAPGKPRNNHPNKPKSARCLDLPPRLLNGATTAKVFNNIPSPTTVLDGPYLTATHHDSLCRSRSLSFGKGRSFSGLEKLTGKRISSNSNSKGKSSGIFGSSRWGSFRRNNKKEVVDHDDDDRASVDFSVFDDDYHANIQVKITTIKRRSSFFSSSSRSHLLTSIYEGFKHAVPWRRRQRN